MYEYDQSWIKCYLKIDFLQLLPDSVRVLPVLHMFLFTKAVVLIIFYHHYAIIKSMESKSKLLLSKIKEERVGKDILP
uniref:Uncharacterized protein n=1 Tax=Lepeophtheirus salmonis TaxID=72036 RepID=A0A0K2UDS0_LEPSM